MISRAVLLVHCQCSGHAQVSSWILYELQSDYGSASQARDLAPNFSFSHKSSLPNCRSTSLELYQLDRRYL
ncbi:hypothetical protein LIPSTDRAFT_204394 [Lipomyces starkeyi NRRL Y-11557]|uniref:Uncharacterized protein n=1 Tax=Lipomyces starkeyi NRRL Y-11557 TaxID=675824 RepID=A0A1E3PU48_LIPST|nr:hypothetical protein LIPSTDRAFT_204394 [Lipomyces starkeyi NRRL Y-11557]